MSEPRVLPTEPGWWWCAYGSMGYEICLFVYIEDEPDLSAHGVITQRPGDEDWVCAGNKEFRWMAPVASSYAVDAAVIAMRSADSLAEWAGKHGVFNTAEFRELNRNAIAGLTGKGGV